MTILVVMQQLREIGLQRIDLSDDSSVILLDHSVKFHFFNNNFNKIGHIIKISRNASLGIGRSCLFERLAFSFIRIRGIRFGLCSRG